MKTKFVENAKIKMFCIKTDKGYVKSHERKIGEYDPSPVDFKGSVKNAQLFFSLRDAKFFIDSELNRSHFGRLSTEAQLLGIESIEIHSVTVEISDNGIILEK